MAQHVVCCCLLLQMVPFLLEDKLKELGGDFSRADDWAEYVVTDGNLITGQNPGEAAGGRVEERGGCRGA